MEARLCSIWSIVFTYAHTSYRHPGIVEKCQQQHLRNVVKDWQPICLHCRYPRHLSTGELQVSHSQRWERSRWISAVGGCHKRKRIVAVAFWHPCREKKHQTLRGMLKICWICLCTWRSLSLSLSLSLTQCSTQKLVNHGKPSSDFDNHSDVCQTASLDTRSADSGWPPYLLVETSLQRSTKPVHAACLILMKL